MNPLSFYDRQKEVWDDAEINRLHKEYVEAEMTISQIADIHHRTPGSIGYKIKNIGIITHTTQSRGYLEYKDSELYKEIVESGKGDDAQKMKRSEERLKRSEERKQRVAETKQKTEEKAKAQHAILLAREQAVDLDALRRDVDSMKKDVKEVLRLINALYDFETQ